MKVINKSLFVVVLAMTISMISFGVMADEQNDSASAPVYNAGTDGDPDDPVVTSTIDVKFIFDDESSTLYTKSFDGEEGDTAFSESWLSEKIKDYTDNGYKKESIDYSGTKSGDDYVFDGKDRTLTVHFTEKYETKSSTDTLTRTVHYVFDDGSTAFSDDVSTVSVTVEYEQGMVSGNKRNQITTYTPADGLWDDATTHSIDGYDADYPSNWNTESFKKAEKNKEYTITFTKQAAAPTTSPADPTQGPADPTDSPSKPTKQPADPTKKPSNPTKKPAGAATTTDEPDDHDSAQTGGETNPRYAFYSCFLALGCIAIGVGNEKIWAFRHRFELDDEAAIDIDAKFDDDDDKE